jgi:hypothetical protein
VVKVLGDWAARWILEDPTQAELDPDLLILWISRHVATEALPARKTVVAFRLYGPRTGRLWLVLERSGVSICHADPGLDPASYVHVDGQVVALYRVYMGRRDLDQEIAAGQLTLAGNPALVRAFPTWFTWSNFRQPSEPPGQPHDGDLPFNDPWWPLPVNRRVWSGHR